MAPMDPPHNSAPPAPTNIPRREFLKSIAGATCAASIASLNMDMPACFAAGARPAIPDTANWPQAAGPNGTWSVDAGDFPILWSGARNSGFRWRTTLPEEGQGGIVVWA